MPHIPSPLKAVPVALLTMSGAVLAELIAQAEAHGNGRVMSMDAGRPRPVPSAKV